MPGPDGYNIPRLVKLREEVSWEGQRDKHNQGTWGNFWGKVEDKFHWGRTGKTYAAISCPSSACAAGWTVVNEHARMLIEGDMIQPGEVHDGSASHCLTVDGQVKEISYYAQELLGLDDDEREKLFAAEPSTETTLHSIDQLICAAKHGRTWWDQIEMERKARYSGEPVVYDTEYAEEKAAMAAEMKAERERRVADMAAMARD